MSVATAEIAHIENTDVAPELQRRQLDLLQAVNRDHLQRSQGDSRIEGVIRAYDLAYRMQRSAPDVMDISQESKSTFALYGIDNGQHGELWPRLA